MYAGLTSILIGIGASSVQDATADGQTRTLSFHHTHSRESLTVTFKRGGRYDEAALRQLNHFLRDWRSQEKTTMDRRLFDILWEVYRDVDGKQPIQIISAYRSPATNAMLRRRSSGVARHSQHTLGHAMDFFIPGVALEKIRFAGLRLQRGGVGFYPTSGSPFVHLDTGSVRHWPRMTYDQLARVFPDGRTVHVPTNGKPLPGYQLALADIQRRGDQDSSPSASSKSGNLLAALFGRGQKATTADEGDDDAGAVASRSAPAAKPTLVASATPAQTQTQAAEAIPIPRAKPVTASRVVMASADVAPAPKPAPVAARPEAPKGPQTPADIINARGFWDDMPAAPQQATAAQIAALAARRAVTESDRRSAPAINQASQALAYAPTSFVDRAHIMAASAPIPPSMRPGALARSSHQMAANTPTTVVSKASGRLTSKIATSARLAAATLNNDVWLRAMILTPSARTALRATALGEPDMTTLRVHFVKPTVTVAMTFSDDPNNGMSSERFTGSATAALPTEPFAVRTAWLR
ncbi:MAG TPA: DUF882 domain-containing protein [Xanthobacteraceae bacterium]|nr:DUF882 domain-containing protein [Xanthobacteraceae bacterium]